MSPSVQDWAARAARKILDDLVIKHHRIVGVPTEERIAAIIVTFAEPILNLLHEARRTHDRGYHAESCDYPPCPKSEEDADDDTKCTCAADKWNARIDEALR